MSGPVEPRRPSPPDRGPRGFRVPDPQAAKRSMASAYQGAIEAVIAMGICLLAGWWVDDRFGSGPFGLFAGMGIGFAALLLRLLRIRAPGLGSGAASGTQAAKEDTAAEREMDRNASWSQALDPDRDLDEEDEGSGRK
jgi:F0F1-type ATP synthase assembly protein I